MAGSGGKKAAFKSPHTKKQREILEALERAARRLGLKVSTGRLLLFAGLRLKGGSCRLRDHRWLVLDRTQPFDDLVDIYRQVLTPEDLVEGGLSDDQVTLLTPYLETGAEAAGGRAA
jgi:hypothetical protein